jgi:hypothetical protein
VATSSPISLLESGMMIGYFKDFFRSRIEGMVNKIISVKKPKKVIVNMIYYPQEDPEEGAWSNNALWLLGYDRDPSKLQLIIRKVYESLKNDGLNIEGTEVQIVPLFKVLDPKNPNDYISRVEPSIQGGRKMANAILDVIEGKDPDSFKIEDFQ